MKNAEANTLPAPSAKYQYIAAIAVNLLTINWGFSSGWSSPSVILLTSDETPLPAGKVTMEEASWIVSHVYLGGVVGNVAFGFITNRFGRKWPLIFVTIPMIIISWALKLIAQNIYYLYAARLINGFAAGGVFVIVPLFTTEIAADRNRGTLGAMLILSETIGILLIFIFGNYCDYYTPPKVAIALAALCGVLLIFFPESPSFLMKQNRILEAERSIRFYQNLNEKNTDYAQLQMEIRKLQSTCDDATNAAGSSSMKWSDLTKRPASKAIIIGLVLALLDQLCGVFAMLNYTANVFEEAGSSMSANKSAIVVGAICTIGSYVSTYLVDRAGRKILFAVSTIGTAIGLTVLGTYVLLKSKHYEVDAFNWVPLVSFSFVIFIASLGVLNLPFVVIPEVMPKNISEFGVSLSMTVLWTATFVIVKFFPLLNELLGSYGSMYLFAVICLLGEIFIALYVPETKGKSYEQIMDSLR